MSLPRKGFLGFIHAMKHPYHTGELLAQERANEKTMGERNGRAVTNKIIPGAVNFIEKLQFFVASSRNESGEITISPLAGSTGFIKVTSESTLEIDPGLLYSNPADIFWVNIKEHKKIGLLFIELSTRRRFRVNGSISFNGEKITVSVDQAYPNCPKYIQQRSMIMPGKPSYGSSTIEGNQITETLSNMIRQADTFFVGSGDIDGNMDASHRGGLPGFIHIRDSSTLVIPDYAGNSMYNTLGNFLVNPMAGILLIDFENKKSLQLQGTAQVSWRMSGEVNTGSTNRFWTFTLKHWILSDNMKGLETKFKEYSQFNPS